MLNKFCVLSRKPKPPGQYQVSVFQFLKVLLIKMDKIQPPVVLFAVALP